MFCISSFQRYTLNVSFTSYHESQPIHKTLWAMIFSTRANFQSTSSVKYMLDGCEVLLHMTILFSKWQLAMNKCVKQGNFC